MRHSNLDAYYDKPSRPFIPIDTCSPAGTWIEEKRYNRQRPTGATARKVLCGNWQEERALEDDLLDIEQGKRTFASSSEKAVNGQEVWKPTSSIDIIKNKGNGVYAGGFESTPYLTCDVANPNQRQLHTTHRTDYTHANGDVLKLRRPDLGVRSQQLLSQALAAAKEEKAREDELKRQQQLAHSRSREQNGHGVGGFSNLDGLDADDRRNSVYRATIGDKDEVLPVVEQLHQDYLVDEPITLYTGNPYTQKKMVVHGKTPVDPVGSSQFGKHTYFSEVKYAL